MAFIPKFHIDKLYSEIENLQSKTSYDLVEVMEKLSKLEKELQVNRRMSLDDFIKQKELEKRQYQAQENAKLQHEALLRARGVVPMQPGLGDYLNVRMVNENTLTNAQPKTFQGPALTKVYQIEWPDEIEYTASLGPMNKNLTCFSSKEKADAEKIKMEAKLNALGTTDLKVTVIELEVK